jgi:anti-sigma B factor antagonist
VIRSNVATLRAERGASDGVGLQWESAEELARRYEGWKPRSTDMRGFDLVSGRDAGIAWIGLYGEFDFARVSEVQKELRKAEESDALRVVINLTGVTFMDSSALQLLLGARSRMRGNPGRLRILPSQHEPVIQLIRVTDTEDAFY